MPYYTYIDVKVTVPYKQRNAVHRFFNQLKNFRAIATR